MASWVPGTRQLPTQLDQSKVGAKIPETIDSGTGVSQRVVEAGGLHGPLEPE